MNIEDIEVLGLCSKGSSVIGHRDKTSRLTALNITATFQPDFFLSDYTS